MLALTLYVVICLASLFASGLTLFSGFGLGTLLMPVFAVFFPVEAAIALTAVVHLLNNLFKVALLGKHASWQTVLRFGIPALAASFVGAWTLLWLSDLEPLYRYSLSGGQHQVTPIKLVVALLMVAFAILEVVPALEKASFDRKYLPLGGLLSGFFGGLSGHQGAMRSAFLIRCRLTKEGFIGTGVAIACLVDLARLSIYGSHFSQITHDGPALLLGAATLCAFAGAYVGNRLIKKVTMRFLQILVSLLLAVIALGLGSGLL